MFTLILILLNFIIELLPNDPFPTMLENMDVIKDYIGYINWFIPFDIMAIMLNGWLVCVASYYIYALLKKVVIIALQSKKL